MGTPTGIDYKTMPPCFVCGSSPKGEGVVFGALKLFKGRIHVLTCVRCLAKESDAMLRRCEKRLRAILDREPSFVFGKAKQREAKRGHRSSIEKA
jgi:hypothetical protein